MIITKQKKIDFSVLDKPIRTLCVVYAGRQKQQATNLTKIPAGTEGVIRVSSVDPEYNIEHFLVKFIVDGQFYYCKMTATMLDFIK